ncbi:MAG TPA: PIN domain-containing protein [Candidatus Acidoferrum sp.]|nr:PIN domain-containing protein [Candidatus Acidoferrum sp.]
MIDFENVRVTTLPLLKDRGFHVKVFLGPKEARLPVDLVLAMHALGQHADYIKLDAGGSNALDFHIAYYLGKLATENPDSHFSIISKDKGFDPLVAHLQSKKIVCTRVATIEELLKLPHVPSALPKEPIATKPKAQPPQQPPVKQTLTPTLQTVIDNLKSRGSSRPRKLKTLTSTIKALPLKLNDQQVTQVIADLQALGYVTTKEGQVSYRL